MQKIYNYVFLGTILGAFYECVLLLVGLFTRGLIYQTPLGVFHQLAVYLAIALLISLDVSKISCNYPSIPVCDLLIIGVPLFLTLKIVSSIFGALAGLLVGIAQKLIVGKSEK